MHMQGPRVVAELQMVQVPGFHVILLQGEGFPDDAVQLVKQLQDSVKVSCVDRLVDIIDNGYAVVPRQSFL